jgi:hypothetical protein
MRLGLATGLHLQSVHDPTVCVSTWCWLLQTKAAEKAALTIQKKLSTQTLPVRQYLVREHDSSTCTLPVSSREPRGLMWLHITHVHTLGACTLQTLHTRMCVTTAARIAHSASAVALRLASSRIANDPA